MEPIRLISARDLTVNTLVPQHPGSFSYRIDRHDFIAAYSSRQHSEPPRSDPLRLTTEADEHIWLNDRESAQLAAAVRAMSAEVTLD